MSQASHLAVAHVKTVFTSVRKRNCPFPPSMPACPWYLQPTFHPWQNGRCILVPCCFIHFFLGDRLLTNNQSHWLLAYASVSAPVTSTFVFLETQGSTSVSPCSLVGCWARWSCVAGTWDVACWLRCCSTASKTITHPSGSTHPTLKGVLWWSGNGILKSHKPVFVTTKTRLCFLFKEPNPFLFM